MNRDIAAATFIGQIYDVRTKRDGSGRLQIDFGADAIEEIQLAQRVALARNCSFQVALVAIEPGSMLRSGSEEGGSDDRYEIDPDTGEVQI